MVRSKALPQIAADADAAMALVCMIPESARGQRRLDVQAVINRATSARETDNGVAFTFDGSDDVATTVIELVLAERDCCAQFAYSIEFAPRHGVIELHIEAAGDRVRPLKQLYLQLAGLSRA